MRQKSLIKVCSAILALILLIGLLPAPVLAQTPKLATPQNLKLTGTVLSWNSVPNADFYGITLYFGNYQYSIGNWQTEGTSINLYKYLQDGETYGATVIACSSGSYQISYPAELPLTACSNNIPIYRDVHVVNGTASASAAYPGMSVRLEAKPAPEGMVFDRWELSGGYFNIGYQATNTVVYIQAICDNDIIARATYKYPGNVTSAFTIQPQGGAALIGNSFDVTYAMNFTPQGTVKVQVEGNTPGSFTDLKQGTIDCASVTEDHVVTKTFRIMAYDGTRNIYSDEFIVSWEDGPRFISQPIGGTIAHHADFIVNFSLNFTPFNCRVERFNDYLGRWDELASASATQATINSYDFNVTNAYRIKAIIEGGGEVYSDEFTVTWSDAASKFLQHPATATLELSKDYPFTFAINFTPTSNIAIQRYDSGWDDWVTIGYCTSLTAGTISGYASDTTHRYRLEAYDQGTPIRSNEFIVTWAENTQYHITVTGGTASCATAVSGTTVTLKANAAPQGKVFDKWVVTGATVANATAPTTTFIMPAANVAATATYKNCAHSYSNPCDPDCNLCAARREPPHQYGSYLYNNDATCEKDGTKTRTCALCQKPQTITAGGTKLIDSSKKFKDVPQKAWYKQYVDYAVTNGIFTGTSATTFSPNTNMTRAQFVQVFANLSGVDTSNKKVHSGFTDVPQGKWFTPAVAWAAKNGIVAGMGNGKFAPNAKVTREQMCVMIVNYIENYQKKALNKVVDAPDFADHKKIASWARAAVYKCADAKLINGVGKNKFAPKDPATRAQGTTIFTFFFKEYMN